MIAGSTSGTGRVTSSCCSGGPENTYYWYTCGAFAGGTFSASMLPRELDTELDQRSACRATVATCNDDVGGSGIFACGIRSSISTTIPSGLACTRSTSTGRTARTASGSYSVNVTRP